MERLTTRSTKTQIWTLRLALPRTSVEDYSPNSSYIPFHGWSFDSTDYTMKACNKAGCSPFSNKITLP